MSEKDANATPDGLQTAEGMLPPAGELHEERFTESRQSEFSAPLERSGFEREPRTRASARPRFQEVPVRTPEAPPRRAVPRWLSSWFEDRDIALLVLLAVLNIGSAYTTIIGARQILPAGLSDMVGAAVQAMLFLMLAGFAMNRSVVRRWMAIGLFAFASIYTSFFTYYEQLAKEADLRVQLDKAMQSHATLVSQVYQPARSRADKLSSEAEAMIDLADREANRGSTTGVKGYGPVARKYAEQGNRMLREAKGLEADVNRLQPHFEFDMTGLTPEQVYRNDLEAWQLAPSDWKAEVPAPLRNDYVDLTAQVALLTPYNRVRSGEMPALTALGASNDGGWHRDLPRNGDPGAAPSIRGESLPRGGGGDSVCPTLCPARLGGDPRARSEPDSRVHGRAG